MSEVNPIVDISAYKWVQILRDKVYNSNTILAS